MTKEITKVKLFHINLNVTLEIPEKEINNWIQANNPQIIDIIMSKYVVLIRYLPSL